VKRLRLVNRTEARDQLAKNVYREICKQGGRTAKEIAMKLNVNRRCVLEALLALEQDKDTLVSEDDQGRLFKFIREKHDS